MQADPEAAEDAPAPKKRLQRLRSPKLSPTAQPAPPAELDLGAWALGLAHAGILISAAGDTARRPSTNAA